ncbi:type VI secretion system protein TssR domain-containing protein [Taibaiella soli]|uniref:VWFA domain-containing protein n=1 Tax=Taibaiella soli TaxID=1649169 RepID=A0A2W2AMP6_9BACT|nr:type VI secretion system protein TssR domain-containing protein [Taibaiella soli]PZF73590.1 hypothetical protein DN068_07660 [Taibaiella soli]
MIRTHISKVFSLAVAVALQIGLLQAAAAQVKRTTKVIKSPKKQAYSISNDNFKCENGYNGDKKWIVFAAQEGLSTYTQPAGENRLKTLTFMQPCYVINTDGDYVKLIRYNSSLKFRKLTKNIANWKDVEYLGWVHKSRVLPWSVAIKDANNKFYIKYITALSGRSVIENPDNFFAGDSIKVFDAPDIGGRVKTLLPINTLLYTYKFSDDRKYFLVGTNPQCVPDSAQKSVIGWLPVQTVQPWGEKFYITTPEVNYYTASVNNNVGAVSQSATLDLMVNNDETNTIKLPVSDPVLNRFPCFSQKLYPVYGYKNIGGSNYMKTSALSNILDYRNNKVYNVLGQPITYSRYMEVKESAPKLNIVMVVDGSSYNSSFIAPVMTVLQQLQLKIDSQTSFSDVHYAAVFHRDNNRACIAKKTLPLTHDYKSLSEFFEGNIKAIKDCSSFGNSESSIFEGVARAGELLRGHEDESNVIIVIGSSSGSGMSGYSWSSLVNSLTNTKARLLVYQTHSDASGAYNDFVIGAKNVIVQSADNITTLKKELLVENPPTGPAYDFRLATGDYSVFMLDYPRKSHWQGAVVFPNKMESMPLLTLNVTLDTLLGQIQSDNNNTVRQLENVFESYAGNMGTTVDARFSPVFGSFTDTLPDRFFRQFRKKNDLFRFNAWMPVPASDSAVGKGLLLSKSELDNLTFHMSNVVDRLEDPHYSRKKAARKVRQYVKHYVKANHVNTEKPVRAMTMGDVVVLFTGMQPDNAEINMQRLKSYGKLTDASYNEIRGGVMAYYDYLRNYYNANQVKRIYAVNNTYYWLPKGI